MGFWISGADFLTHISLAFFYSLLDVAILWMLLLCRDLAAGLLFFIVEKCNFALLLALP